MNKFIRVMLVFSMLIIPVPDISAGIDTKAALMLGEGESSDETFLAFHNADIQDVLRLIAEEYDLNIVMNDSVTGNVTLRLRGASLGNTLDAILISRNFDYEIRGNIIRVAPADIIANERSQRSAKEQAEPLTTEIIKLKYLDANDAKDTIKAMLSRRGKIEVLEQRAHKGFKFSAGTGSSGGSGGSSGSSSSSSSGGSGASLGDATALVGGRAGSDDTPRSSTLLVVDLPSQIERIRTVLSFIDVAPKQILIDARILEVDTDSLEDIGFDLNSVGTFQTSRDRSNDIVTNVNSSTSAAAINQGLLGQAFPTNTDSGLNVQFTKLSGEDLTVLLHMLQQDERTKTLSAPKIMTVENQEAAILVGEQFPIFESNLSDQGTATETLSFYLPIGISLQVIAQSTPDNEIIMIVHPSVTSIAAFVTGTTGLTQPRINVREADTRVLVKDNETLVIGGLLEDRLVESEWGVPFVRHLPLFGKFFTRRQVDVDQRNLLIFITPRIITPERAVLTDVERRLYEGTLDDDAYGHLEDRRDAIRKTYEEGRRNYRDGNYNIARDKFLKILSIDTNHTGALKYMQKLAVQKFDKGR